MLDPNTPIKTSNDTSAPLKSGEEPIELLMALASEYLAALASRGMVEFLECVGKDGPVLLAVIANAKVVDGKIVIVGKEGTHE